MKRGRQQRRVQGGGGWALIDGGPTGDNSDRSADRGTPLARLRLEQRRGKPVTVAAVEGLDEARVKALGKDLKIRCGTGGTAKPGVLELQGDHRETLRRMLGERGLRVKG